MKASLSAFFIALVTIFEKRDIITQVLWLFRDILHRLKLFLIEWKMTLSYVNLKLTYQLPLISSKMIKYQKLIHYQRKVYEMTFASLNNSSELTKIDDIFKKTWGSKLTKGR